MKNLIVAAILALLPATARAASFTCETVSGPLNLCIPKVNTDWPSWSSATVNTFRLIGANAPTNSTGAIHTADLIQTRRISGVSTGTPNIWISSPTIFSASTAPMAAGFFTISSGSLLVQSTTPTQGHAIFQIRSSSGTPLMSLVQGNTVYFYGGVDMVPGALTDSTVIGPDIAASTITLNKLNQSGCATNQIPKWSGSVWACADDNSGSNNFTSTITLGTLAYTRTLAYEAVFKGGWSVVAFSSFTAESSITWSNFNSSYSWRVECRVRQNTADGIHYLRFNSDSANNYKFAYSGFRDDDVSTSEGSNSYDGIPLTAATNANSAVDTNYPMRVTFEMDRDPLDSTRMSVTVKSQFMSHASGSVKSESISGGGYYDGSAEVTSFSYISSGGTMTGKCDVLALWNPSVE